MDALTFVKSATRPEQYPAHPNPEAALVGRSNVGKSSLVNALGGRHPQAKVSGRPGRTQTLNFFQTANGIWLVDLPGYGYADVPQRVQRAFGPMIEGYIDGRANLVGVIHVLDARHAPTPLDVQMREWLLARGMPILSVATKWDKLKSSERSRRQKEMESRLATAIVPFSSQSGLGKRELEKTILSWAAEGTRKA